MQTRHIHPMLPRQQLNRAVPGPPLKGAVFSAGRIAHARRVLLALSKAPFCVLSRAVQSDGAAMALATGAR